MHRVYQAAAAIATQFHSIKINFIYIIIEKKTFFFSKKKGKKETLKKIKNLVF